MLTSAAEGAPCSNNDRIQLAAILAVFETMARRKGSVHRYRGREVGREQESRVRVGLDKTYHSICEAV